MTNEPVSDFVWAAEGIDGIEWVGNMIPVELAEVGRRYRYNWYGRVQEGELVKITHSNPMWCQFAEDRRGNSFYGCKMSDVIGEL